MERKTFQIRVCRNPECGLRYPWYQGQPYRDRCPHCLGLTEAVHESRLPDEPDSANTGRSENPKLGVLLDNIRSAWNVGSILRTAEGFGFTNAYLCGITPTPENPKVRKSALGAEEAVAWSAHKDATLLARRLREGGWYILALETGPGSIPLAQFPLRGTSNRPILLMVGSEVTGLDPTLLEIADGSACLPMQGKKRSFNVAVAFGAAAYAISAHLV